MKRSAIRLNLCGRQDSPVQTGHSLVTADGSIRLSRGRWQSERLTFEKAMKRYAVGDWAAGDAFEGFSAPTKLKTKQAKIGRSLLLGDR